MRDAVCKWRRDGFINACARDGIICAAVCQYADTGGNEYSRPNFNGNSDNHAGFLQRRRFGGERKSFHPARTRSCL